MKDVDTKRVLLDKYIQVARRFVDGQSEKDLYHASLFGRELLKAEVGPTEVIQLHFNSQDAILEDIDDKDYKAVTDRLRSVLLEIMMVFGESHQQVREVLGELQRRYDELDRTKQKLEHSRDELREKTAQLVQTGKINALGELSAGVAHEINQPLNAAKIIHQDILRDIEKDRLDVTDLKMSLKEAVEQMRRVAEIVDHMRLYTRKTTGERREPMDIEEPITGVLSLIGHQLSLRSVKLHIDLDEGLRIVGDQIRLEQVFMNLLVNARDAVLKNQAEKGKNIRLKAHTDPQNRTDHESTVVLEIRDNGSGISDDAQKRIFEPFFTTKAVGEGTGLGLSVTREIIEEHGGQIEVESKEGEGTTFRIFLPALTL